MSAVLRPTGRIVLYAVLIFFAAYYLMPVYMLLITALKPFDKVQYWFKRDGQLVKKTVTWFLMKPVKKTGTHDPEEILETRWVPLEEALTLARYKSDKQLLNKLARA